MAKGRDKHQDYLDSLNGLGKTLSRRSGRRCELSDESGPLHVYDLLGPKVEPHLDHVVHVSLSIKAALDGGPIDEEALRPLEHVVWSDTAAVRQAAVLLLKRINSPWALEAIENAQSMNQNEEPSNT